MTEFNFKDKLHVVERFRGGPGYATAVWLSPKVATELVSFAREVDGQRFLKKIDYVARVGFLLHRGGFVRDEPHGTIALGMRSSLFRLYGFYDASNFVGIAAKWKRGQKLGRDALELIDEVARVRDQRLWEYAK